MLVDDLGDLVGFAAAGRGDFDRIALGLADQCARERGGDGEQALRDVAFYLRKAKDNGEKQGAFMAELLCGDVPWAYIRQAQHLLRLTEKYGGSRVEAACGRALAFGLINVSRVERIIKQSLESSAPQRPTASLGKITPPAPARFVREAGYFNNTKENDHGDHR